MNKFLKFVLGMLGGAVIGTAIVAGIVILTDGDLSGFHGFNDVKVGKLILSLFYAFFSLAIAVVINIMLHEAGHLFFGLLTGYKFVSYRAFNITLIKDGQGLFKWKRFSISGTLGQCLMSPPLTIKSEDLPYFWYNAGGVIANLFLATISAIILKAFNLTMFWECFFFMMLFVTIAITLMNGLPLQSAGLNNDGRNILELFHHPEKRSIFRNQLLIAAETSRGKRTVEMPAEWFPNPVITDYKDILTVAAKHNYICWLEDHFRFEEALQEIENLMEYELQVSKLIRMELGCDWLMLVLVSQNRPAQIERINTKQQWDYLQTTSKISATKLVTLYAWQLIHEQNPSEAEKILIHLRENQNDYAFIGEAHTAIALIEHVKELHYRSGTEIT